MLVVAPCAPESGAKAVLPVPDFFDQSFSAPFPHRKTQNGVFLAAQRGAVWSHPTPKAARPRSFFMIFRWNFMIFDDFSIKFREF